MPGLGVGVPRVSRRFRPTRPGQLPAQRRALGPVCADRQRPVAVVDDQHILVLRNVERSDQYVLIVNDRYGSAYEGTAYPRHPLAEDQKRSISVTWYEYLSALRCGKPLQIGRGS